MIELSIYEGVSFFGMILFLVRMAEDTRRFFQMPKFLLNDRRSLDTAYLWGLGGGQLSLSLVTEGDGDLIGLSKVLDHAVRPFSKWHSRCNGLPAEFSR